MSQGPLTEEQIEWLDEALMKYATEHSVLDVAEMDGLLTAMLSGPESVDPAVVLQAIWGGEDVSWETEHDLKMFVALTFQHMNDIADRLNDYPEQYEPLFGTSVIGDEELTVVSEWCFGYLRGVALLDLDVSHEEVRPSFDAIALHGQEDNIAKIDELSKEGFLRSIEEIKPAALSLHSYWHRPKASQLH